MLGGDAADQHLHRACKEYECYMTKAIAFNLKQVAPSIE